MKTTIFIYISAFLLIGAGNYFWMNHIHRASRAQQSLANTTEMDRQDVARISLPEDRLRGRIVTLIQPKYPATSLRNGIKGVAVAEVLIRGGAVGKIRVLQAPDSAIERAVETSIRSSVFESLVKLSNGTIVGAENKTAGQEVWYAGKLTYYFDIVNGAGVVAQR